MIISEYTWFIYFELISHLYVDSKSFDIENDVFTNISACGNTKYRQCRSTQALMQNTKDTVKPEIITL